MRAPESLQWNAYPSLAAAGLFAWGILLAKMLSPPLWAPGLLFLGATLLSFTQIRRRLISLHTLQLTACALATLMAAGAVRYASYYSLPADHFTKVAAGEEVLLSGTLVGSPRVFSWGSRFVLRVETTGPERLPASGLLSVTVTSPGKQAGLRSCDRVQIAGRLEELPRPRNPGQFDYGRYLARRKIFAQAETNDLVLRGPRASGASCLADDVRDILRSKIRRFVRDAEAGAVVEALVLGDRSVVDRPTIEQFTRTGLLHLLAVSGLHVMVVGLILYRLLGPMLMRFGLRWRAVEAVRSAVTALILLSYMLLTGAAPSVVRAVVMTILLNGASVLQRTANPLNSLGSAALVILAIEPAQLFEPGFQLSFAAVGGILGIKMPVGEGGFARGFLSGIAVSVSATAATLPVVVYHFGRVSLGGLLLNILAVPVTSATLCSAVATLAASTVSSGLAEIFGASTELLARILLRIAGSGDEWLSWSYVRWNVEDAAVPVALALAVSAVGCRHYVRTRWRLVSLTLFILCGSLFMRVMNGSYTPRLDVHFVDVGQGDAILLLTPERSAFLIDAGVRTPFSDSGSKILLPLLDHLGIRRIHTTLITHPDSDHLGGLPAVLRGIPVGRVVTNGVPHTSRLYEEVTGLLDSLSVPSHEITAGDSLHIGASVRISVLYPESDRQVSDPNDASIILHVAYGRTRFLFMGDAPVAAEMEVLARYGSMLEADVLKVGHHGSGTSSSHAFLANLRRRGTTTAVISVAGRNRYGLPDSSVVRRIRAAGLRTYSTAEEGAVWLRSDGRDVEKVEWR